MRELLEEVTRLATSNDAVGPEVGGGRPTAELLREFRPLLLDGAGSATCRAAAAACTACCYLRHVKRSLRIISHRKDDEVNRSPARRAARLVRLAEKMEELRPLLQREVLYNGERGGGGEGRRAGRSVDRGAASFRLRRSARRRRRRRGVARTPRDCTSRAAAWERAHRGCGSPRRGGGGGAGGGGRRRRARGARVALECGAV